MAGLLKLPPQQFLFWTWSLSSLSVVSPGKGGTEPYGGLTDLSKVAHSLEHLKLSLRNTGQSLSAWSERLCRVAIFHTHEKAKHV